MSLHLNAHTLIFVEWEELPREDIQNQLFVYEFSSIASKLDPGMGKG
jgi:hypothetical protein